MNLESVEGREKSQKFEYLKNKKSVLGEIKNICHGFKKAVIW